MTETLSVTQAERDKAKAAGNSLPDGSYPINDAHQLHAAAVLAASHHGDWKAAQALIRRRAKELGVDVTTLPGFGGESKSGQRDPAREQRRKRWAGSLVGQKAQRSLELVRGDVEIRAKPNGTGGTNFEFNGYAATFNEPFRMWDKWGDEYEEDVRSMAFQETLGRPDLDTPFLIGHKEDDIPIARTRSGTLRLATDTRGLHANAPDLDGRNDQVRRLASAIERGDMDEMSIGFITRGQEWSEDYSRRSLTSIDLHRGDVSVVALAANPATRGVSMVALPTESLSRAAAERRAAGEPVDPDQAPAQNTVADHGPFTGTHSHGHPAYGAGDGDHDHGHRHADDAIHDHPHAQMLDTTSSHAPREQRGNPVDQDLGGAPDYEPDGGVPHTDRATCGGLNPAAAKYCSWCGDALVRIDADGVPAMEEEQGSAASLAASRRREFELLLLVK